MNRGRTRTLIGRLQAIQPEHGSTGFCCNVRQSIIVVALIFASSLLAVTSCRTASTRVLSKPPVSSPAQAQPLCASYIEEFQKRSEKYYWTPTSPDNNWKVSFERENPEELGRFYSLQLQNNELSDMRIIFTLWDADVGSGVRAQVRWSNDGKALHISGDTRGFNYEPWPAPLKYQPFQFIYLIEDDKLYSLTGNNP